MPLRIGLDFDNTLIDYDDAFAELAVEQELIQAGQAASKREVKDALFNLPDGERVWMRLQGYVYGRGIAKGKLINGVADFLKKAHQRGDQVFIVSHKTEFGHFDETKTDLREAARGWMRQQGFFDALGLDLENVFFKPTRDEKVAKIASLNLDVFVDDLPEVLTHKHFPKYVKKLYFAPGGAECPDGVVHCPSWEAIDGATFGV